VDKASGQYSVDVSTGDVRLTVGYSIQAEGLKLNKVTAEHAVTHEPKTVAT